MVIFLGRCSKLLGFAESFRTHRRRHSVGRDRIVICGEGDAALNSTLPNLVTPAQMTQFWDYLHWALLQSAPFLMVVVAAFAVYLIIRQIRQSIWPDREDDDIEDNF